MKYFLVAIFAYSSTLVAAISWNDRIRTAVLSSLNAPVEIKIDKVHFPKDLPSETRVEVASPEVPLGIVQFRLKSPDGTHFGKADIRGVAKVAIARRALRNGELFKQADIQFVERDLTAIFRRGVFLNWESLNGQVVRGHLPAGSVVYARNVQAPIAIRPGQMGTLTNENAALRLRAVVRALQPGRVNDWIRVKNPQSGSVLTVRVTGPGELSMR